MTDWQTDRQTDYFTPAHAHGVIMWRSMTKPTILGTTSFWVKATITKYNLWSTDHANLKSLAPIGSEIWTRMYLDRLYYNFTASIMKHCLCMFLNWFKTTKSYHRQLVWFISHTESQHNMVGFAMDGHIRRNYFLMSSLKWAQHGRVHRLKYTEVECKDIEHCLRLSTWQQYKIHFQWLSSRLGICYIHS